MDEALSQLRMLLSFTIFVLLGALFPNTGSLGQWLPKPRDRHEPVLRARGESPATVIQSLFASSSWQVSELRHMAVMTFDIRITLVLEAPVRIHVERVREADSEQSLIPGEIPLGAAIICGIEGNYECRSDSAFW